MKTRFKKKANILDIPLAGILMFVAAIVFAIAFMTMSEISDGMNESGEFSNESMNIIQHQVDIFPGIWDKGWLFVLVGLGIFTWISAFFIRSHPVFFMFGFFLIVIYTFMFGLMSNTYADVMANPTLSSFANEFTLTKFVMGWYPIVMAVISTITAVLTYSKGGEPRF